MRYRVWQLFHLLEVDCPRFASRLRRALLCGAVTLGFLGQQLLWSQSPRDEDSKPDGSELFFEGYISNAVFKFAGGEVTSMIYYGGIEYDRKASYTYRIRALHFWDAPAKLVHARQNYVAEFLPVVLIRQPINTDIWGDPLGPGRKTVPGIAISPLGFRWTWFQGRSVRPLWTVKLGEAVFTQKALGNNASYENFTVNSAVGFLARLSPRTDLRLGYGYQHVSNAYSNGSNPGLDTVGPSFGFVYHISTHGKW